MFGTSRMSSPPTSIAGSRPGFACFLLRFTNPGFLLSYSEALWEAGDTLVCEDLGTLGIGTAGPRGQRIAGCRDKITQGEKMSPQVPACGGSRTPTASLKPGATLPPADLGLEQSLVTHQNEASSKCHDAVCEMTQTRSWNSGPGAGLSVAPSWFLRESQNFDPQASSAIHLLRGLTSLMWSLRTDKGCVPSAICRDWWGWGPACVHPSPWFHMRTPNGLWVLGSHW